HAPRTDRPETASGSTTGSHLDPGTPVRPISTGPALSERPVELVTSPGNSCPATARLLGSIRDSRSFGGYRYIRKLVRELLKYLGCEVDVVEPVVQAPLTVPLTPLIPSRIRLHTHPNRACLVVDRYFGDDVEPAPLVLPLGRTIVGLSQDLSPVAARTNSSPSRS